MIRGVFPRLFGNFREGALLRSVFVTSGTTTTVTFALKAAALGGLQGAPSYQLTLARTGVGLYTLTLPGGARNLALVSIHVAPAAVGRRGLRFEPVGAPFIVDGAGTIALQSVDATGGAIADTITATDEIHVLLYADK